MATRITSFPQARWCGSTMRRKRARWRSRVDEVKATPQHEDPETPVDWDEVNQFERGMLGGGFAWPYPDV